MENKDLKEEQFVPKHLPRNGVIYKFWDFLFAVGQAGRRARPLASLQSAGIIWAQLTSPGLPWPRLALKFPSFCARKQDSVTAGLLELCSSFHWGVGGSEIMVISKGEAVWLIFLGSLGCQPCFEE